MLLHSLTSVYRPVGGFAINSVFHPQARPMTLAKMQASQLGRQHIGTLVTYDTVFGVRHFTTVHQGFAAQAIVDECRRGSNLGKGQQRDDKLGPIFHKQGDTLALLHTLRF